jgi:hypothetical protein
MIPPELIWVAINRIQERAGEYARQQEIRKLIRPADRRSVPAEWLGAWFIYFGDWMRAFGERLCPSCPCPDMATGSGGSP